MGELSFSSPLESFVEHSTEEEKKDYMNCKIKIFLHLKYNVHGILYKIICNAVHSCTGLGEIFVQQNFSAIQ